MTHVEPALVERLKDELVAATRLAYERGYIVANVGNLSVRLPDGSVLITAAGITKRTIVREQIVRIDLDGNLLDPSPWRASSEFRIHTLAYRHRPDVGAVVHAHPPMATTCAIAGIELSEPLSPELVTRLGPVPLVPYGRPGTDDLPARLLPYIKDHDGFLLENHGAMALGTTLDEAFNRMELIETYARYYLLTTLLQSRNHLPQSEVEYLLARKRARNQEAKGA